MVDVDDDDVGDIMGSWQAADPRYLPWAVADNAVTWHQLKLFPALM
jgi:hypothetical protein